MASVYFDPSVGGDGTTVTDDSNASTGLANGGHRTRFVPALSNTVAVAQTSVDKAIEAAASATTALNAPGTSATSVTSLLIGTGSKSLTLAQTGKAFALGQPVIIASTASPTNWMAGTITAFTAGTGAMTVSVSLISGSGTLSAWTVSLCGPALPVVLKAGDTMTGALTLPGDPTVALHAATKQYVDASGIRSATLTMTGNQTLTAASLRASRLVGATGSFSVTLPSATTIASAGGVVFYFVNDSGIAHDIRDNAARLLLTLGHGESTVLWCSDTTTAAGVWVSSGNERVVSFGTEALARNSAVANFEACQLSTDKALIVYQITGSVIQARVVTLSGTAVTLGTAVSALSSVNQTARCCKIGTDKAIIAGYTTGSLGTAVVATVSGTTITIGTPITFDTSVLQVSGLCQLNTDKALFLENRLGGVRTTVLTATGTTLSAATTQLLSASGSLLDGDYGCAVQLGTDRVFYSTLLAGGTTNSINIYTVSGTVTTFAGGTSKPSGVMLANARVFPISPTKVVLVGIVNVAALNSYFIGGCVISIPVNTPLFNQEVRELTPQRIQRSLGASLDVCMLGSSTGLVVFGDPMPSVGEVRACSFKIVGSDDLAADAGEIRLAEYQDTTRCISIAKVSDDKVVSLFREADTFGYVQGIALRGSL